MTNYWLSRGNAQSENARLKSVAKKRVTSIALRDWGILKSVGRHGGIAGFSKSARSCWYSRCCHYQQFLGTHSAVYNLFNLGHHLVNAEQYRNLRVSAFSEWSSAVASEPGAGISRAG